MPFIRKHRATGSRLFTVAVRDDLVEIACAPCSVTRSQPYDWSRAQHLFELLRAAFAGGATTIVVDLQGSGAADTSLLAVLIDARGHARRSGADLVVRGSPALHQLVEICRLESVLAIA